MRDKENRITMFNVHSNKDNNCFLFWKCKNENDTEHVFENCSNTHTHKYISYQAIFRNEK